LERDTFRDTQRENESSGEGGRKRGCVAGVIELTSREKSMKVLSFAYKIDAD
jgi:hypothetical protein